MAVVQSCEELQKVPFEVNESALPGSPSEDSQHDTTGTADDQLNMLRMGKKQELRREFGFISIVGFMCILQATWESALLSAYFGLFNGGKAGVIWVTTIIWLCVMAMIASLAEMASMAPTAGGQYHWVSEFAPRSVQKPLSYTVGWFCCLGWVSGIPAGGQFLTGLVQGILTLVYGDAAPLQSLWQSTLLVFGFLFLIVSFNAFLPRVLPKAEIGGLILHCVAFVVFMVLFWSLGKPSSAKDVFATFTDGGGWGNKGVSCLVGVATPLWIFIGPDAGAHMAEELHNASRTLPVAMIWATLFNGVVGIAMLITFCFFLGDLSIIQEYDYPVIEVIANISDSNAASIVMTFVLIVLAYLGSVSLLASASRQVWAFARDGGFPYSSWIRQVHPKRQIPLNSLILCLTISLILSAIQFGSTVALNAIISVSNAALTFSYIISIGCIRLKRLRGEPLLPRKWSLGRWGGPINDISLISLVVSFVFSFFPETPRPAPADMNWACLIFGFVALLAVGFYRIQGRHSYVAPVYLVKDIGSL